MYRHGSLTLPGSRLWDQAAPSLKIRRNYGWTSPEGSVYWRALFNRRDEMACGRARKWRVRVPRLGLPIHDFRHEVEQ